MWLRELVGMQMPFVADVKRDLIETYYRQWKAWFEKEDKHASAAEKPKSEPATPENPPESFKPENP